MITTSGGCALVCRDEEAKKEILFYATQARESYPYYQHEHIGYNYRMSNICAGIGRGQMTVIDEHIAHPKHVQALYRELLADVKGVMLHENPSPRFDSNFWLCAVTLDPALKVKGQENAYKKVIIGAVGGAAFVAFAEIADIHLCDHFLFVPLGGCGACLAYNLGHCGAAAASAGLGDGAEGAITVPAVLHLEEKACALA